VQLTGQRIAQRLYGRLMHAIADSRIIKTWPMTIAADKLTALSGAHAPGAALAIPQPVGAIRAERRVPVDGVVMMAVLRWLIDGAVIPTRGAIQTDSASISNAIRSRS
jgi:phage baseplate assembly protein W